MNKVSFLDGDDSVLYRIFPFYSNGIAMDGVYWGMTLKAAGSMRFRWNEVNSVRDAMLMKIANSFAGKIPVPVQLDHTKIVYRVDSANDTYQKIGDGIITQNKSLMPVVTVADCVPVYLYAPDTGYFGVVHSGWKGTGIVAEAIEMMVTGGAARNGICVAIGAHIRDCCYVVNEERAEYFSREFTVECVKKIEEDEEHCKGAPSNWNNGGGRLYRLSLFKANLVLLEKAGIKEQNITYADECTCCNSIFGSNRRETSMGSEFTVQAAFTLKL